MLIWCVSFSIFGSRIGQDMCMGGYFMVANLAPCMVFKPYIGVYGSNTNTDAFWVNVHLL